MQKQRDVVVDLRQSVRAWVAESSDITIRDLARLQQLFNGKLNIVHTNQGQVAIFPHCPGDRSKFDHFMDTNGRFTQRPIQITAI